MKAPLVLHFIYLICCKGLVDGLSITLNKNAVRNNDVQILITLTSSITSSITLTKPDGTTTVSCGAPLGGPGLCSTTDLSQDLATGITTYSISSLVRSTDEGTWSAAHGGTETGTIDIKVLTIPTLTITQSISALTLTSSNTQELTITATCAYPAVSLDLYFVPTGGGSRVSASSSTSTCTNIGGTGCADTDALSYSCVIVPKLETSLSTGTYHVLFLVNLNGQYESTGLNATITGTVLTVEGATTPPPTPTPRPCQCSWLPCGWKCYYMYIIIVAVVLLVCLVVGLCCCYRRGYFGMGSKEKKSRENSHVNKAYTSDIENGQPTRSSGGHREQTPL